MPESGTSHYCDVLVVGGGLAGGIAAIKANEYGAQCILIDKGYISRSGSSAFAAGMINVCTPDDNKKEWMEEIIEKGEYLNDQEWVNVQMEETYSLVQEVEKWGFQYGKKIIKRDNNGHYQRIKGRGNYITHSVIVSAIPLMDTIRRKIVESKIPIYNKTMAIDLIIHKGRVAGLIAFDYINKKIVTFYAKSVIMASSGCGFKSFFIGHRNLTGEGQVMSYENGAILNGLEQACSNTTAKEVDLHGNSLMVGLGAKFRNKFGHEFMNNYDSQLGNKAINTILTIAFCKEVKEGRGPIYMDLSGLKEEDRKLINEIVPEGIKSLESVGIKVYEDKIEWIPAFYGTICQGGGIDINTNCETSIPGLYAAGDSTCSPQQGTYSVTGLNLSFCFPSGERAARFSSEYAKEVEHVDYKHLMDQVCYKKDKFLKPLKREGCYYADQAIYELQRIILPYDVCYLRSKETLEKAIKETIQLKFQIVNYISAEDEQGLIKANEAINMVKLAELVLKSCLFREESRGHLYREDFPYTDNDNWLKWVMVKKDKHKNIIFKKDVPLNYVRAPEGKYARIPNITTSK
jgi:succinate dehydrogenase / fumarate reductase, flavoprotein subunit